MNGGQPWRRWSVRHDLFGFGKRSLSAPFLDSMSPLHFFFFLDDEEEIPQSHKFDDVIGCC